MKKPSIISNLAVAKKEEFDEIGNKYINCK